LIRIRFLLLFVSLAALCTVSSAAPEVRLGHDGDGFNTVLGTGQWFDLLVRIDPKDAPVLADSVAAEPTPREGAEFGDAIYPAPDTEKAYTRPFVVRLPARLAEKGKQEVEVIVTAKGTDGADVRQTATAKLYPGGTVGHVQAKVALKETAVAGRPNAVVVTANVIEGYHVYGEAIDIGLPLVAELVPAPGTRGAPGFAGGGATKPAGEKLYGDFTFEIPFTPTRVGEVGLRVLLNWQACTQTICDPNELAYVPLSFQVEAGSGDGSGTTGTTDTTNSGKDSSESPMSVGPPPPEPGAPSAGSARTAARSGGASDLSTKSILELILLAIGGGLFALAMPCTYPLIPITISFFTKQAETQKHKVVPLALAYGLGIVAIFTLVGVVFGEPIIAFATLWWVNAIFALLFLVFGLSLIGLFEIRLPGFFNDLATKASGTGGYLSVFAMGTTLVITSFTCTAPIVGLVLVFAAKGGSLWVVALTMAVFGLTMAVPFAFLSLSPNAMSAMPRSGEWMKTLKVTLGIVELGLVLKFVSNMDLAFGTFLIGRELFLVLWGLSFLVAALYLFGVFDLLRPGVKWTVGRGRAAAGVFLLAVTAYLYTGTGGARLYKNLEAFLPDLEQTYTDGFLAVVKEDFEKGVETATRLGAPIFLDFTGFQ